MSNGSIRGGYGMSISNDTGDKITPHPAFRSSIDLLIWAIIAIQVIVAVYGFVVLPDTIPIHWGFNGQADGYGPKWVGTFLHPLISIGIYLLIRVLMTAGPRLGGRENVAANLQVGKIVLASVMLFMLIIQLSTIAKAMGVSFNMSMVIMLAVSVLGFSSRLACLVFQPALCQLCVSGEWLCRLLLFASFSISIHISATNNRYGAGMSPYRHHLRGTTK